MLAVIYCEQNLLFVHPDHLCFDRTTYDNINGPGGPFMFNIIGPARPLMYPDQIFRDNYVPCMHMSMHLATWPTPCTTGQVHLLVYYVKLTN